MHGGELNVTFVAEQSEAAVAALSSALWLREARRRNSRSIEHDAHRRSSNVCGFLVERSSGLGHLSYSGVWWLSAARVTMKPPVATARVFKRTRLHRAVPREITAVSVVVMLVVPSSTLPNMRTA